MYVSLLNRQLKRNLKEGAIIGTEWLAFLDAVNHSYEHYERDELLTKRSLEISSAELRQFAIDLADKEMRTRAILEAASDGILVINEKNEIEVCNQSAVKYLGYDNSEELIGKNIEIFQFISSIKGNNIKESNDGSPPSTNFLSNIFSLPKQDSLYEFALIQQKGASLPIELSISDITLSQKKLKICVLRDISLRKQSEKKIALRHEITHFLLEAPSLQMAAPKILSILCIELGWEIACFWLKEEEQELIKHAFFFSSKELPHLKEFKEKTIDLKFSLKESVGDALSSSDNICFYSDLMEYDRLIRKNEAIRAGLHSYIRFPVFFEDKFFGAIELFTQKTNMRDDELIKVLHDIGSEIGMFIERQNAQQRELNLQKQLVTAARQAGMMQVATNVLHNVGNILNSVNISIDILKNLLFSTILADLPQVIQMLKTHKDDLPTFLTEDPKGKYLPDYFEALFDSWQKERDRSKEEIKLISENFEHIKNVIKMQQSIGTVAGVQEKVSINQLLNDLMTLKAKQISTLGIKIKREYENLPEVMVDKSKLFQILENLILNAVDALKVKISGEKILTLRTFLTDINTVQIEVRDNGCGIDRKHLEKIFSFGFTTKKEGHGFGLHSSALLAKEIKGKLEARSAGLDKGATFIMTLPLE